ncbi:MAG: DUF429 domain-containing protein [candidate division KSB1 bacterium]|nr:DUF429 domain-containing protein [candidate division KSB1 bacterium]
MSYSSEKNPIYFGGIDPTGSETRASGCAVMDSHLGVTRLEKIQTDQEIMKFFLPYKDNLYAIGLDGPCKLPQGLFPCCFDQNGRHCNHTQPEGKKGRLCERQLAQMGIGCFFTTKRAFARGWVLRSLNLFEKLTQAGFPVLEIYPYGAKRCLFGKQVPKKSTRTGTKILQELVSSLGIKLESGRSYSHDELDAVIGAYTCYLHWCGKAQELGNETEGKIVLPLIS